MSVASQNHTLPCAIAIFPISHYLSFLLGTSLTASAPSFLHASMNLHLRFLTASPYTAASNAVTFQSPTMTNAQISLCTQSAHSFSFTPCPLRTAPSRFPDTIRFGSRLQLIRMSAPTHKRRLVRNVVSMLSRLGLSMGTVARGHPAVWSLALCPDDTKQDQVVYGEELGVVFLIRGSTYCIHRRELRFSRPLPFVSSGRALLSLGRRPHAGAA